MKKLFKSLLSSLYLLIAAVILGSIVLPIGFLYDIGHSAYKAKIFQFFLRFLKTIREVFKSASEMPIEEVLRIYRLQI